MMARKYKRGRWFGKTKSFPGYYHTAKELTDLSDWAEHEGRIQKNRARLRKQGIKS